MSKPTFYKITFLLVGFIITVTTMTVRSQSKSQIGIDEKYYHQMEQDYRAEVKQLLEEKGFQNSGITMTKHYLQNGGREYNVVIHNKYITRLSKEQQQTLKEELAEISFPAPDCSFFHDFLKTEG